jgi:hypothetical protein
MSQGALALRLLHGPAIGADSSHCSSARQPAELTRSQRVSLVTGEAPRHEPVPSQPFTRVCTDFFRRPHGAKKEIVECGV